MDALWSSTSTQATVGRAMVLAEIGITHSWPVSTSRTVTSPVVMSPSLIPVNDSQRRASRVLMVPVPGSAALALTKVPKLPGPAVTLGPATIWKVAAWHVITEKTTARAVIVRLPGHR